MGMGMVCMYRRPVLGVIFEKEFRGLFFLISSGGESLYRAAYAVT